MAEKVTLKQKYSRSEFRKQAAEILLKLTTEVGGFADASAEAQAQRRERCREDHFEFFRTYLPHYFSQPEAPFHHELVAMLDKRPGPEEVVTPGVVAAPREGAKSTITSFGYSLHQICYALRHFIILGSDTEDLASDLTGYLYLELLYNERLRMDFGELAQDNWAVDDFVTLNDIRVKARGRGQRLRGLKHKQWRPDLVILDDMENDQNVKNPDLVRKLLEWILGAVYPSIDAGGNLFIIGTILARKSALYIMTHSDEEPWRHWQRVVYKALFYAPGPDGKAVLTSFWPAKDPVPKLLKQKELMGSLAFNKEKMNDPINEGGTFQESWIVYYQPVVPVENNLLVVGWFDPSLESGATADFKSIITLGVNTAEMIFDVLDAYIKQDTLERAMAAAFVRHQQYGYRVFAVEDNLFQRLLLKEFDRLSAEKKIVLPVRGITNVTPKETRVARLSPYVERGRIRFQKGQGDQELLIEQLLYFPSKTVHDDGPDALEGAVRVAEECCLEAADVQAEPDFDTYRTGRPGGFRSTFTRISGGFHG